MDRLGELGTARGHAQRDVDRAKKELARAEAEYAARDIAYRRFISTLTNGEHVLRDQREDWNGGWIQSCACDPERYMTDAEWLVHVGA
ncbi:hypothetical protein PBI_GAIA_39 [Mycobacterium phage Gaia]|uniref:Uncharacterized protein n=1 Tax=Mycobacterium phage Gaia TaxID=1486472 RepID=A0A068F2E4_9CAUD|nr:hypothetical protein VC46_gp039 [Mycobacterium phage Gaia]AID58859.1 hypothetical protein PBI_GAIA_39 [Mycobacterium phage Gaia]AYQ99981.1 hypothetical protein PBI_NEBKISS_40 [Mycobacterium phage Nebkiss]